MNDGTTVNVDCSVLIAGAGPTGLMLACELARRGVSIRLIEASTVAQIGSRGKGIQPRTLEVFENLGIVDRVLANGQLGMAILATGPDGRVTVSGNETAEPSPDVPYTTTLITPEWRIEEALRQRLSEFGGAVEFGTALSSFEQSDHAVSAKVLKDGRTETITARWLVGCDGGHSTVRRQAGIAFEGETRGEIRMIVADVEAHGLERKAWQTWSSNEGVVSLCPLPSTNSFQYQAGIAPEQNPELSLQNMQEILQRRSGRTDIRLQEPQWSSLWRLNVRIVDRYRNGRVFLAGDAAHIHSPAGGQGMNTGIQDAHNLGWKLAAVVNGSSPDLLHSYESERRPVAVAVIALSNERLKQAIEQKAVPTQRNATTMQLSLNYRGSELAWDDRDDSATLRAGDRAPDATRLTTIRGEQRLFTLTSGGCFTLLNFGGEPLAVPSLDLTILNAVEQPSAPDAIGDPEGHLATAYGAGSRTLVLIRPDGYVGLISDAGDTSAVLNYLAKFK